MSTRRRGRSNGAARVSSAPHHRKVTSQPSCRLGRGLGVLIGLLGAISLLAQPSNLTVRPVSLAVSIGDSATFQVRASGAAPFTYQWWFTNAVVGARPINGDENPSAVDDILNLTDVQVASAGGYYAVVTDTNSLSATSQVATLTVDPTFTKITTGDLVNTPCPVNAWVEAFWADHDGDGDVDVTLHMITKLLEYPARHTNFVYRNEGDGTFTRLSDHPIAAVTNAVMSMAWADFDHDGDLDPLCNLWGRDWKPMAGSLSQIYCNDAGSLTPLEPLLTDTSGEVNVHTADWVDYDGDGWLDVFVGRVGPSGVTNLLFRNQGNGTFAQVTTGILVSDKGLWTQDSAWADFDNDGRIDLVATYGPGVGSQPFYHNEGGGVFTKVPKAFPGSLWGTLSYADFDNDGDFDVWNADYFSGSVLLYANRGDATFERRTGVLGFTKGAWSFGMAWGDYDNDGWLDVAITGDGGVCLFHSQGNATFFTAVTAGSPVKETGSTCWCSWVDVNRDGFLDLFVGPRGLDGPGRLQRLYLTNPTTNHWLVVRPSGTLSSRTPVGAKVRVLATPNPDVNPNPTWQLRQISGSGMYSASYGDGHVAHFGLGKATNVQTLRIEWPSGAVQELVNVAANQILSVWEPPAISATVSADGACELTIKAEPNRAWEIKVSADLRTWETVESFTNATVGYQFTDPAAAGMACRFYRVASE